MATPPLFAGFDLGTSNSAVAVFDGSKIEVVRNSAGNTLTPSVVRIDARGRVTVGTKAMRALERDPGNVQREFKRLMGTAQTLEFESSKEKRLPEELSAEILRALRRDVEDVVGVMPTRAVISVPALFELPQNKATSQAANLAGFEQVELLQEPIASALAAGWDSDEAGAWMVYDLGGGTFDVSLLETRDGLLRIVGHDGDNFLGGRDFDRAIVDWMITELRDKEDVQVDRKNSDHKDVLSKLRLAAEAAKIELSRAREVEIVLEEPIEIDGREVDVELSFTRDALEAVCAPLVARSLKVCERLLASNGLQTDQLSRVVLVGGPSVMPMVRRDVEAVLATRVVEGHDPMTLVAQGAALFAATAGLDGRVAATKVVDPSARKVWCQFPPVTADLEPYVIGRFEAEGGAVPTTVRLERIAPNAAEQPWTSTAVVVDEEHAFVIEANLVPRAQNRFRLVAMNQAGERVMTEPNEISIIQGLTIGDPPLSRSIGVALADDTVHTYFERGTSLPSRRTFKHNTVETIAKGSAESSLSIPIVQGEYEMAHLCQLVGTLRISGEKSKRDIPGGTPVEMTLVVDRGGKLSASARVLQEGKESLTFEGVAQLIMPEATTESLQDNLRAAHKRIQEAQGRAFRDGATDHIGRLNVLSERLENVSDLIDALSGGDTDAGQSAARLLLELDAALSELDSEQRWPELESDAQDDYAWALHWSSEFGKESEHRLLDRAGVALDRALERKNVVEVMRQVRVIRRIGVSCYRRDATSWVSDFEYCTSRLEETTDLKVARGLLKKGEKAVAKNDMQSLRSVVRDFWDIMPSDPETRRMSFESGVR